MQDLTLLVLTPTASAAYSVKKEHSNFHFHQQYIQHHWIFIICTNALFIVKPSSSLISKNKSITGSTYALIPYCNQLCIEVSQLKTILFFKNPYPLLFDTEYQLHHIYF
jgi:hypothetical protein